MSRGPSRASAHAESSSQSAPVRHDHSGSVLRPQAPGARRGEVSARCPPSITSTTRRRPIKERDTEADHAALRDVKTGTFRRDRVRVRTLPNTTVRCATSFQMPPPPEPATTRTGSPRDAKSSPAPPRRKKQNEAGMTSPHGHAKPRFSDANTAPVVWNGSARPSPGPNHLDLASVSSPQRHRRLGPPLHQSLHPTHPHSPDHQRAVVSLSDGP